MTQEKEVLSEKLRAILIERTEYKYQGDYEKAANEILSLIRSIVPEPVTEKNSDGAAPYYYVKGWDGCRDTILGRLK